jgi:hypothetical protein
MMRDSCKVLLVSTQCPLSLNYFCDVTVGTEGLLQQSKVLKSVKHGECQCINSIKTESENAALFDCCMDSQVGSAAALSARRIAEQFEMTAQVAEILSAWPQPRNDFEQENRATRTEFRGPSYI